MKFTEKDLFYNDYSWAADGGDDAHYRGYLDKIKVDKTEGYEVLYFCNTFLLNFNKEPTKENFQRVEKLLRHKDLSDIDLRSELNSRIDSKWHLEVLNDIIKKYS
ncbi:hypothetical protein PQ462_12640 [Flavobacterium sp. KACC 22758]|uniref:hypothetical protein n=1 Tax=Flavobacterium sp. KACC 22758 TaxID=3025667 RepID=UPI002365831A|nr:hypothetical protein [Flavobacterium sp. KACC 22758]WDF57564.1 hypothetical protein PQ462_12640 [Flavobacterium sp. KACC 22758]